MERVEQLECENGMEGEMGIGEIDLGNVEWREEE